ncbi:MAG: M15 family metallopeptidase [Bernardetiaceae bacterium]|nr:M15 family metallopeptidase [Bernardetiaceae bacterium]
MRVLVWFILGGLLACQSPKSQPPPPSPKPAPVPARPASVREAPPAYDSLYRTLADTAWVELIKWDPTFVLDIKYATTDNFTKQVLYDCGRCFLRKRVAQDLVAAHAQVKKQGYRMKIFDGYRPLAVQWKMWNATPSKSYVANPRKGSMHNRGGAVDLTLVDAQGQELDMGSPFDFFGKQAHLNYPHPAKVLANRKVLQTAMKAHHFNTISNEWWHFSHQKVYAVSDFPIPCQ